VEVEVVPVLTRVHLSRLLVSVLAGLLLVGAAVATPASAGGGYRPTYQEVKCNQGLFKGRIPGKLHAECGLLTVKENRLEPFSADNTVVLPVVVIPARTKTPEPVPLVMLAGGPGDGGIDAFLASGLSEYPLLELAANRDVILLDQRGTGDAQPGLYCPEVYEAFHAVYETTKSTRDELGDVHSAYTACIDRLRSEGVDVNMYNNYQSAKDLRDLRRALGLERWNVYGQSYGTMLALELMRQEPWRLRSAMLDSSVPPYSQGGMGWEYLVADVKSAFERNETYFDYADDFGMTLEEMAEEAQQRYNNDPFTLDVTDYVNGATRTWTLTGDDAVGQLSGALGGTFLLPALGLLAANLAYYDTDTGVPADLDLTPYFGVETTWEIYEGFFNPYNASKAWGQFASTYCADVGRITDEVDLEQLVADEPLYSSVMGGVDLPYLPALCPMLDIAPSPRFTNVVPPTIVPTLVTNGGLDTWGTSAELGADLTDRLGSRAQHVVFPGIAHITLGTSECTNQAAIDFLNEPGQPVDTTCIGG
jgi:pimeloyl-ACP methyl ester carboxylesterase